MASAWLKSKQAVGPQILIFHFISSNKAKLHSPLNLNLVYCFYLAIHNFLPKISFVCSIYLKSKPKAQFKLYLLYESFFKVLLPTLISLLTPDQTGPQNITMNTAVTVVYTLILFPPKFCFPKRVKENVQHVNEYNFSYNKNTHAPKY